MTGPHIKQAVLPSKTGTAIGHLLWSSRLDRAIGADRHKCRRLDGPAWKGDFTIACEGYRWSSPETAYDIQGRTIGSWGHR